MKIIVDAFGGDNAPSEVLKGCRLAANKVKDKIILVGNKKEIEKVALKENISLDEIGIYNAESVISMCDNPMEIIESKGNSSMAVALRLANRVNDSAFISAGNSGALAVGATLIAKRINGIKRCAFATLLPNIKDFFILLDSGMNVECRPDMLFQFALMGSVYMKEIIGKKSPKIGLLNVGNEISKGDILRKGTYEFLEKSNLNFIGNIEASDILTGKADVIVTDGFTGNIVLKFYEGIARLITPKIDIFLKQKSSKYQLNYSKCGSAPIMGSIKPIFKLHGNADAETFKNAIFFAVENIEKKINDVIVKEIQNNLIKSS